MVSVPASTMDAVTLQPGSVVDCGWCQQVAVACVLGGAELQPPAGLCVEHLGMHLERLQTRDAQRARWQRRLAYRQAQTGRSGPELTAMTRRLRSLIGAPFPRD